MAINFLTPHGTCKEHHMLVLEFEIGITHEDKKFKKKNKLASHLMTPYKIQRSMIFKSKRCLTNAFYLPPRAITCKQISHKTMSNIHKNDSHTLRKLMQGNDWMKHIGSPQNDPSLQRQHYQTWSGDVLTCQTQRWSNHGSAANVDGRDGPRHRDICHW
jgi:hypothetical protein